MKFPQLTASLAALSVGAILFTTGCGGGDSSSTDNTRAAQRDLAFAIVHSVRATTDNIDHVGDAADQNAPNDDTLELDTEYNLYFRTTLAENPDFRLDYFEDAAATRPAGYLNGIIEGEFGEFPFNLTLQFDVTKGNRPERGDLALRLASATNGTLEGTVTDYRTGDEIELDLTYRAVDDTAVGMVILTPGLQNHRTGDKPVYFTNLVAHADETFQGDLKIGTGAGVPTGTLFVDDDNSGNLQIQIAGGTLRADWDEDGKGTIRFPGGATQTVADFDAAHP